MMTLLMNSELANQITLLWRENSASEYDLKKLFLN